MRIFISLVVFVIFYNINYSSCRNVQVDSKSDIDLDVTISRSENDKLFKQTSKRVSRNSGYYYPNPYPYYPLVDDLWPVPPQPHKCIWKTVPITPRPPVDVPDITTVIGVTEEPPTTIPTTPDELSIPSSTTMVNTDFQLQPNPNFSGTPGINDFLPKKTINDYRIVEMPYYRSYISPLFPNVNTYAYKSSGGGYFSGYRRGGSAEIGRDDITVAPLASGKIDFGNGENTSVEIEKAQVEAFPESQDNIYPNGKK